ncbi:transposase [Oceanispirochaeta sp.]|uniref:transposase n=1 Tax=Oceanispirochaeta sp. TaxID=2035350 RepID=UPI00345D9BBC
MQRRDKWEKHKSVVRGLLFSDEGVKMRSLRPIEPESVFGEIKKNMGFKRFQLRGQKNVSTEWGLESIAHNIKKLSNLM